jgi:hypothetical protein
MRAKHEHPRNGWWICKVVPNRELRAAQNCAPSAAARRQCRKENVVGRRPIGRIALEQNLAAQTMQESIAPVFTCLVRESEGLVDSGQRSLCVVLHFDLSK